MRKIHIYIIGGSLLGLVYSPLKEALNNGAVFFLVAIIYLLIIRLVAENFGKP